MPKQLKVDGVYGEHYRQGHGVRKDGVDEFGQGDGRKRDQGLDP